MKELKVITNSNFEERLANYPDKVKPKIDFLRNLIIETAREIEEIDKIEEKLKWNEPSFITKNGSTLRMDWKEKTPNQYALYFQCTTKLVDTFKLVFSDKLKFEGNRAIIFELNQKLPIAELKECIRATLNYHKVKGQLNLGI